MNFSVIIPTRNKAKLLVRLLKSIDKTRYKHDLDLIIVNNGGDKNLKSVLQKQSFTYISPRVLFESKIGPSYARNAGILIAKYTHIIFFDDDCVVPDNIFTNYEKKWKEYPNAKIIGGRINSLVEDGKSLSFREKQLLENERWPFVKLDCGNKDAFLKPRAPLFTANLSIRLDKSKNNLFNTIFGIELLKSFIFGAEDCYLCNETLLKRGKVLYSPELEISHYFDRSRFKKTYLFKRFILSGIEMAVMENVLNTNFNNKYENFLYKNYLKKITSNPVAFLINYKWHFSSIYKITFIASYLIARMFFEKSKS
jgi:glycosyltransferase involved in cell wall biosynthesis